MAKIWQKDYDLDKLVEGFTVGRDYQLDIALVAADCVASLAHAKMLSEIGILSEEEFRTLEAGLRRILEELNRGEFRIELSDEDCHTAIENALIASCGEAGKKIHTGRSRNDQVITTLRMYGRAGILEILEAGEALVDGLIALARRGEKIPMPGRTHMQAAMPSSVGLWAAAFAEDLLDGLQLLFQAYAFLNQSSLGSAASYGVPLPLDRERSAALLGFAKVQNNVLYVNNSRGKFEAIVLDALDIIVLSLSKMAQDLILFSLPEFGYFSLPPELCSGSSIMPQKKNPDALELIRGKSATISGYAGQVKGVIRSLPTGYNRDFQETKEPFLRGLSLALESIRVSELTIRELKIHEENLKGAFSPEIYATDAALELVAGGMSFRDAYRKVGLSLEDLKHRDPVETIAGRTYQGSSGNLNLEEAGAGLEALREKRSREAELLARCVKELTGSHQPLF